MTLRAALASLAVALALAAAPAFATDAAPTEKDPVAQARAVKLSETLRCLVCQNQTIADSNAELAVDLRRQVREQIAAGKTDDEIIRYMTDRYGDFVLYRPPFKPVTYLLWLGPPLFLVGGLTVWYLTMKKRRALKETPVDEKQIAAAAQLLDEK